MMDASALDTRDADSTTSARARTGPTLRRASQPISRRVSAQSPRAQPAGLRPSHSSAHSKLSKDGPEGSMSPTKAVQAMRDNLTSVISKGTEIATNFTSPLAQIYQPLVVDDDLRDDEEPSELTQPNMVSYGPVSRRRLSSMHRFPPMAPLDLRRSNSRAQHAMLDAPQEASPRSPNEDSRYQGGEISPSIPEPVSQVYEDEGGAGSTPQVVARLNRIEERQKRLEDLILQLSSDLKVARR